MMAPPVLGATIGRREGAGVEGEEGKIGVGFGTCGFDVCFCLLRKRSLWRSCSRNFSCWPSRLKKRCLRMGTCKATLHARTATIPSRSAPMIALLLSEIFEPSKDEEETSDSNDKSGPEWREVSVF